MIERADLDHEQERLLYAIRVWCVGRPTCDPRALQRVADLLDEIGATNALAPFSALMNAVWVAREGALDIHAPCCGCFGQDERSLLALLAAGRRGCMRGVHHHAAALAEDPLRCFVMQAALAVGHRLSEPARATLH